MATSSADVHHLLRRAGFAPTAAEVAALTSLDRDAVVNAVLDMSTAPAVVPPAELADPKKGDWDKWVATTKWWIDRMRTTNTPLQEKMTIFWHSHFATSQDKVDDMGLMFEQNEIFRQHGLGNFRDLVHLVCIHPSMLLFLDSDDNKVGAPNENLARELMELFTLGVNQYTQADVVASARAWTGHGTVAWNDPTYKFWPGRHDDRAKTIFGETKNWDGPDVIDGILSGHLDKKAISARFIARKMWGWFAYPNPPGAVLDTITAAFLDSDLNITELMRSIFMNDEFYSANCVHALVRNPIEYVVAMLKYTGIDASTANPQWWLENLGMRPFYPPNVAGWKQNAYFLSSASFWSKADFAANIGWKVKDQPTGILSNESALGPAAAIQAGFDALGIDSPSPQTRTALENWLATQKGHSGQGWLERGYLVRLLLLTPDFQLA